MNNFETETKKDLKKLPFQAKSEEMPQGKKKKTKKDPNAPKKGLSAYMFFVKDTRQEIKEQNPDATFGEIGKLLGEAWKKLEDKSKYEEMAKQDKVRYESEVGTE